MERMLKETVDRHCAEIGRIREELSGLIESLPDNPNIKRINDRCFVISSKHLSPDLKLSPQYYDFKAQYREIISEINKTQFINTLKVLNEILHRGTIKKTNYTFYLHPEVIKNIRGIMEG